MIRINRLLGVTAALGTIKPPGRSFDDWERFLDECREAGVAGYDEQAGEFVTPLGEALLKRWRWLQDARERGISFEVATVEFDRGVDAARSEQTSRMSDSEKLRARQAMEAADARRQRRRERNRAQMGSASEAAGGPDWHDSMHTFADDAGL